MSNWRCSLSICFVFVVCMNMGVCECLCSQFSPTQEELDAVVKCKNEVVVSSIKYPLFFGVVAGSG